MRKNVEEKGRPPRHTGREDIELDRAKRRKDDVAPGRPEMDAIKPRRDTTAPGDGGDAPEDIDVAMPDRDYKDSWK